MWVTGEWNLNHIIEYYWAVDSYKISAHYYRNPSKNYQRILNKYASKWNSSLKEFYKKSNLNCNFYKSISFLAVWCNKYS